MPWIFCAGMIRSGSTLQYQLTSSIVEQAGIGCRVPYAEEVEFAKVAQGYDVSQKFCVFKAHLCRPPLAEKCISEGALVIYSYRDIRDVAVSAMRKFDLSFEDVIGDAWLGDAIASFSAWTAMPRTFVSRYENMVANVELEAQRINEFLGRPLERRAVSDIASEFSLDRQRARAIAVGEKQSKWLSAKDTVYDDFHLIHHNHIYQGEIGGWRRWLSNEQQSAIYSRYFKWLQAQGYV